MNKKFTRKVKELFEIYKIVKNKSRQCFIFQIIFGLIKIGKVQLPSIAEGIKEQGDEIKISSIIHRLEDFFREAQMDYKQVALFLLVFLGTKEKIRLSIDRTNWEFGQKKINILMVIAHNSVTQVPIYFELLDNENGNSSTENRIDLLNKLIEVLSTKHIGLILGDREFIGHSWLKYLKNNGINFCVRVPKHHQIELFDGRKYKIEDLDTHDKPVYFANCLVDGVWVSAMVKKLDNDDFLFLIGTLQDPRNLGQVYRKRWKIETIFQSFKGRGFDLESTHMKDNEKLKKLVAIVSIAFAICHNLGITQHKKVQKIKIKNHGYKSKSFCRTGIDFIRNLSKQSLEIFNQTIEKSLRFIIYMSKKMNIIKT